MARVYTINQEPGLIALGGLRLVRCIVPFLFLLPLLLRQTHTVCSCRTRMESFGGRQWQLYHRVIARAQFLLLETPWILQFLSVVVNRVQTLRCNRPLYLANRIPYLPTELAIGFLKCLFHTKKYALRNPVKHAHRHLLLQ